MMRQTSVDTELDVDHLLSCWHQFDDGSRVGAGFGGRAAVVGEYVTSRQYDDTNGALDAALHSRRMKQVGFEVSQLRDPHRSAIQCLARALALGYAVFMHPRLPADKAERDALVLEARALITVRFIAAGLV